MLRKLIFFILSSVVVYAVTIYFRLGANKPVDIKMEDRPEIHLLYKEHFGAYHKINDVITAVEKQSTQFNFPCQQTFGEYLDDPRTVEERRLRSYGGCLIAHAATTPPPGLLYKTLPARTWLVARFAGAPSISPMTVYPKAQDYMETHGLELRGPVVEIYTIKGEREALTEYLFPVEKGTR